MHSNLVIPIIVCVHLLLLQQYAEGHPSGNFLPNTYVIEFERPIHTFASKRHMLSKRSIFYEQLKTYNISYDIRHEYDVINAVSIAFKTPQDSSLFFEKALGVKKSWPVNTVLSPKVYQEKSADNESIPSLFNLYNVTGITRVRDELGITGKNVKVGIIDTGIDYTHPALGGCFGEGCRVAYGYDFVGDDYTGENVPVPDNDPLDNCNGHGTHVAGIIGAKDTRFQFTGIAPEVLFGAYRIFGCSGSSSDDIIMKAMEQAYLDGMDVLNLSLGDVGWPESPASLLADELALKGMIVCAAAGNEGEKGIFEVGAPSLGKHALSIASVDNAHVLSHTIKLANGLSLGYTTANGQLFNLTSAEIVTASDNFLSDKDGCDPFELDVKGKMVLFNRGGCMFSQKIMNAQNAGAVGALIYNNDPGPLTPSVHDNMVVIEYGGLSRDDGYLLFNYLKQNPDKRQVEFLANDSSFPIPTAGTISSFSSWGLGPDLSLKPDLSAPGGQIYSTYPLSLGGYATLSGTSMASPYVAGVVALLQESRGGNRSISAKEIRTMLINNGHPFNIFESDQLESVARQGSGLIDAYQAVRSDTMVLPEQIRLSDAEHTAENYEYTITIKNNGRLTSEYLISHSVASAAQGFEHPASKSSNIFPLAKPIILSNHEVEAQVDIPHPIATVEANGEVNVTVRIAPPAHSDSIAPTIYSGYIVVTKSDEREDAKYVPYAGLTSNLSDLPVLLVNETTPHVISQHINPFTPAIIAFQLAVASPLVTVTAVSANDTAKTFGYIPGGYASYVGRNSIDDPSDVLLVTWYGNIASTPEQAALGLLSHQQSKINKIKHKDDTSIISAGEGLGVLDIVNMGTKLDIGSYKLKVMALRPFGNPDIDSDYDTWLSPEIFLE